MRIKTSGRTLAPFRRGRGGKWEGEKNIKKVKNFLGVKKRRRETGKRNEGQRKTRAPGLGHRLTNRKRGGRKNKAKRKQVGILVGRRPERGYKERGAKSVKIGEPFTGGVGEEKTNRARRWAFWSNHKQ